VSPERLDARNLLCPLPVIRTQDRAQSMSCGALLEVVATDPGVVNDIPAWCRLNGHNVRSIDQEGREIIVLVEIGSGG